ncbi:MAG TPA: inositol 2-dehydrogenase [Bacteroidales bacterium]|nr:inositol 2-dehydrogenase [Bacteroidales bacterium]HPM19257.1 inositol 2-dehydrogenase [Bacteroidales bacterium]
MKKLKLGVIGAGRIGKVHIATLVQSVPQAEVVALAETNPAVASEVAKMFGITSVFTTYMDVIRHPDVEAVVICSPTDTHAKYIVDAANAGKHIFCEKPVDLSLDVIKGAIKAVEKAGVKLMVGFNRRFDPNFSKIRQLVATGKIGDPHILKITSRDPAPPPAEYSAVSGGMFMDMTIHDFDMARFITGSEVTEVYAKSAVLVDPEIGKAGDIDTAVITLSFANGAIGVIDNSRKAVYGYDQRVEIFGSKGMACADNDFPDNHRYYTDDGIHGSLPLNFFMDRYLDAYANEMKVFCDAVLNDKQPPVTGTDGLRSVLIAMAAKKSYLENRPVKLSEIES